MDGEGHGSKAKFPFHSTRGENNDLYSKLWHACAGPSVYVPRSGDKVLYFPQGHMEQVEAYMSEDGTMEMPIYNLPWKILCRVLHVELKVEPDTDEIFAEIILLPEAEQDEQSMEHRYYRASPRENYSRYFSKKLTPSDIKTHGGFSIPKRHANDGCLPLLDMSQEIPQQELLATDLHGHPWYFRHVFRGYPKRNLLTTGWSTFVTSKKLAAGDSFIFLRGENGEFGVGVRQSMTKLLNSPSPSIISAHSVRHGILASAFHAFATRSIFNVYYRPWTRSSEFITPLDQYIKAVQFDYCFGTRCRMRVEGGESGEQRSLGTIIGTEDLDPIRWQNSKWRCVKVKWDPAASSVLLPERVCPWSIDLTEFTKKKKTSTLHHQKRARPNNASSPEFSSLLMDGMFHGTAKNQSQSSSGVLQGQEDSDTCVNQSSVLRQSLPHLLPQDPGCASMQQQMHKQLQIQIPTCDTFYQCSSSTAHFSGRKVPGLCNGLSAFSSNRVHDDARATKNGTSLSRPNGSHRCMVFGVNLFNGSPELPSPQVLTSSEVQRLCSTPLTSQSSVSIASKGISSKQCNNCCSIGDQTCTKVLKYGTNLGRSVDLYRFNGYKGLILELDHMFDFNGKLIDGSSGWHITYTDEDGDMMLIGDPYPWQKFQHEVRRMVIHPKEEINRLNPSSPSSASY
ncbi:auxin response factor 24-like [Gossypium arboreum]|uniref:auxin response factor 24-like n=1 Tax=Gossypium arboreum TaxID=29729 RepID=UPI0008192D50|nr:auxin response factor 24-like [Gossypium arboreum]